MGVALPSGGCGGDQPTQPLAESSRWWGCGLRSVLARVGQTRSLPQSSAGVFRPALNWNKSSWAPLGSFRRGWDQD